MSTTTLPAPTQSRSNAALGRVAASGQVTRGAHSPHVTMLKWSLMTAAIFWTAVYKLSERGLKVPDFVYVNF